MLGYLLQTSFTARVIMLQLETLERATDGAIDTAFKIPKVLPIALYARLLRSLSSIMAVKSTAGRISQLPLSRRSLSEGCFDSKRMA